MRYKRIRYLDRFILYDFIRNLIILYCLIPRSPNFKAHKLKKCQWKAILILPLVHSVYIKQSIHTKLHRYSADGDTSTTIILCRAHAGASGRYVPGTCGRIGWINYQIKNNNGKHQSMKSTSMFSKITTDFVCVNQLFVYLVDKMRIAPWRVTMHVYIGRLYEWQMQTCV